MSIIILPAYTYIWFTNKRNIIIKKKINFNLIHEKIHLVSKFIFSFSLPPNC